MISDERAEKAVEFIRDRSAERGQLRGAIACVEHHIKVVLAQAFLEAEGTVAERESASRVSAEYLQKVAEHRDLVTEMHTLETRLKAAELTIEVWRSQSANNRRGNI